MFFPYHYRLKTAFMLNLYVQSQAEGYEDPSVMMGSDADKEFARAKKLKGAAWCADVGLTSFTFSSLLRL